MYIMGLDIGTTGSKSVIFDKNGKVVSKKYNEYKLYHREPHLSELNPEEVWATIKRVVRESIEDALVSPREIMAVSTAVLGEAFMPVDQQLRALYWSMTTYDARAVSQTVWWEENFGSKDMYEITGQPLTSNMPIYTLQKIQWIKENEPNIFTKTWKFLCWEDYFNLVLTGDAVTDYTIADRTMCFDIRKKKWSDEILDAAGLNESMLPDVKPSGYVVGEVTQEGSREVGLAEGTLVVTGGHDQPCGALGAGIVEEGSLMDATGTVECYGVVQNDLILNDQMRKQGYAIHNYVSEDKYSMLGSTPTGGSVLRWFRDNFGYEEKIDAEKKGIDVYDVLTAKASKAKSGASDLFLYPYFEGSGTPTWNRKYRGILIGLTLSHKKIDVIRALLESLAYELRWNIETITNYGIEIKEIRAIGGGAKSPFWLQLKADVTGREILTPESKMETAALGAGILAAKGAGMYRDLKEASKQMCRVTERYIPQVKSEKVYNEIYNRYVRLSRVMKDVYAHFELAQ